MIGGGISSATGVVVAVAYAVKLAREARLRRRAEVGWKVEVEYAGGGGHWVEIPVKSQNSAIEVVGQVVKSDRPARTITVTRQS
ncbi:hypothetical protein [Saccharothrix obliqua]|uniref:hypothetical protein n=1 Tax=Saccharothrix obliqua TaxID=2861747 RepID=UPI001C5EDC8D|nr:hypothetical protein [Saccharothrix obliqua]MBW4719929.1 hypothetical protein [Saccharothrix obliqua]